LLFCVRGVPYDARMVGSGGSAATVTGTPSAIQVATRIADVLRDIARGGLAGAIAGVVVGGLGGRVLMTIAAVLNPDAAGRRTENGNLVGVLSIDGTLALVLFGGLAGGLIAGVVWVVVGPWLPSRASLRAALAFVGAVALGGFFVIQSTNTDFEILEHDVLIIVLFLALVGLVGAAVAWLDAALDRRLPRPERMLLPAFIGYGALAALGAPALIVTLVAYFDTGFGPRPLPAAIGWALVAVGVVTALWWIVRVATGREVPQLALTAAARIALFAAVAFGLVHLVTDVARILTA
jgi:hypothetical protein